MIAEQIGSTKQPISVDDQFFEALKSLIAEFAEANVRVVAEKHTLTTETVRQIGKTELSNELPDSVEAIMKAHTVRVVQSDLRLLERTSFNITYDNQYSFQTDNLDHLFDVLKREPGKPESLAIHPGNDYSGGVRLGIRITASTMTGWFRVSGPRREVDHFARRTADLFRASAPEQPWLHTTWPGILISGASGGSFALAYAVLASRIFVAKHLFTLPLLFGFLPVIMLAVLVSTLPIRAVSAAYPRVQFEYGPHQRQRQGKRALIYIALTVVILPWVVALLSPW